ncbi:MAG: hypothetical protein JWO08_2329, partial [Verrucomicrobiaceae bacterium]|nr:hypothetical protein [Verrucomicrobiaceae bacterium]
FKGNRIDDSSCSFDAVNVSGKSAGPVGVVVLDGNEDTDEASTVQLLMEGLDVTYTPEVRDAMAANLKLDPASMIISGSGCHMLQLTNGANVVKMPKDRVMVLGRSDRVACDQSARLPLEGAFRIAVGPGSTGGGITMTKVPTQLPALAFGPNALLESAIQSAGIVAAGGGNIIAAGGGNIVAGGGGNLSSNSGGVHFVPMEGGVPVYFLDANGKVLPQYGNGIVAAGGGNIVAGGGGNIVAAGGGNIVAAGGGNLLGQDAASLQGKDPLGIVAAGGGNIVAAGGGNIVAAGGGNIVVLTAGNIVAAGGGNLIGAGGSTLVPTNFK